MPPRKARPSQSLLKITQAQLQALSDQKATELMRLSDSVDRREARHALSALVLGTVSYALSLGACVYLAMHGFPKLAATALGTPVLTVIKRMLDNRI
jgi:hypothetical protein